MRPTLAIMTLALLTACADVSKPVGNLPPPEYGAFAMRPLTMNASVAAPQTDNPHASVEQSDSRQGEGRVLLTGSVAIAPALKKAPGPKIVFLIARSTAGGPPVIVKRLQVDQFPTSYTLTANDVMLPDSDLGGEFVLTARLDADGSAGPAMKGDMENTQKPKFRAGAKNLRVTIDKAI